jgi:predicted metal-dependent hydrolase
MNLLIAKTVGLLKIQKPYKIILKDKLKDNAAEYYAMYRKDKLCSHVIRVNLSILQNDQRDLNTLIVHELIHAWQEETGLIEIHGKYFQKMAKILGNEFNLPLLYMKKYDK